jgi:hypothetical protein
LRDPPPPPILENHSTRAKWQPPSEEEKVFVLDDNISFKQNEPRIEELEVEERAMLSL